MKLEITSDLAKALDSQDIVTVELSPGLQLTLDPKRFNRKVKTGDAYIFHEIKVVGEAPAPQVGFPRILELV